MASDESVKRKAVAALLVYSFTDDEDEVPGRKRKKREIGLEEVRKKRAIFKGERMRNASNVG